MTLERHNVFRSTKRCFCASMSFCRGTACRMVQPDSMPKMWKRGRMEPPHQVLQNNFVDSPTFLCVYIYIYIHTYIPSNNRLANERHAFTCSMLLRLPQDPWPQPQDPWPQPPPRELAHRVHRARQSSPHGFFGCPGGALPRGPVAAVRPGGRGMCFALAQ